MRRPTFRVLLESDRGREGPAIVHERTFHGNTIPDNALAVFFADLIRLEIPVRLGMSIVIEDPDAD